MKFNYQARTKEGEIRTGQIEAFSKEAAIAILQKYGLYPTFIEEAKRPFYAREIYLFRKVSLKDLVFATRELAIMFRSGVPFVEAISSVAQETQNLKLKEIFFELAKEVKSGSSLSDALARYPEVFSSFYISMVKIGEISGQLPQVLESIAEYLERNYHFTSRIRGALLYPTIVIFLVLVVVFLIFFIVGPKLVGLIATMEKNPPFSLQILLAIKEFFKNWGALLFLFFSGIIVSLTVYFETPTGKEEFKRISLKLPFLGSFLKTAYLARFGKTLATLISAGVPIAEALEVGSDVIGENIYKDAILTVKEAVQAGESLSNALKKEQMLFPPFFWEMIAVGEKTGNLSKTLLSVSEFYEKELERKIETFSTLVEPVLIIFVGIIVGLLVITVFNAIYSSISGWEGI